MRRSQEYRYLNEQRRPLWVHLLWAVVLAVVFWLIGDRLLAPFMHRVGAPNSGSARPAHDIDVVIRELPRQSKPLTPRARPKPQPVVSDRPVDQPRPENAAADGNTPHQRPAAQPATPPAVIQRPAVSPGDTAAKPQQAPIRRQTAPAEPVIPRSKSTDKSPRLQSRPAVPVKPSPPVSEPAPKPARPKAAPTKPVQQKPPAVQPSDSLDEISRHPESSGNLRIRLAARYPTRGAAEQAAMRLRPVAPSVAVVTDGSRGVFRVQLAAYAQRDNARQFVGTLARNGVADAISIE